MVSAADDPGNKIKDPGMPKEATRLVQEFADESTMIDTNVPMSNSDEMNTILRSKDGEAVFRKTIDIPENMSGKVFVFL